MSDYRRWYVPGGTYFFTVVTYGRRPILCEELGRACLHAAIEAVRQQWPFEIVAIVLLPEHLHTVWTLPRGDDRYSTRWRLIKEKFTQRYLRAGGREIAPSSSRKKQGERGIWQRRFWEHLVPDEDDLQRCVDYVHWNPRKHGLVARVRDWPWSSFHRFVELGEYDIDWGGTDPTPGYDDPEWGE
jgi:putative transposase